MHAVLEGADVQLQTLMLKSTAAHLQHHGTVSLSNDFLVELLWSLMHVEATCLWIKNVLQIEMIGKAVQHVHDANARLLHRLFEVHSDHGTCNPVQADQLRKRWNAGA